MHGLVAAFVFVCVLCCIALGFYVYVLNRIIAFVCVHGQGNEAAVSKHCVGWVSGKGARGSAWIHGLQALLQGALQALESAANGNSSHLGVCV